MSATVANWQQEFDMFPKTRANAEELSTALMSAIGPEQLDFGHVVAALIVVLGLIPFASQLWLVP